MYQLLIAIGTLLLIASFVCVILASNQYWQMQFELNDRLPESEKFEPRSWLSLTTGRWSQLRELQGRVLPDSSRPTKGRRFSLVGLGLFVCSVVIFVLAYARAVGPTGP